MKNKFLVLATFSFFLFSCGNSTNEKSKEQTTDTASSTEHHHHEEESTAIALNNGEKWLVNAEMMVHVRNMENDVSTFDKAEQKDYKVLAEKLKVNIDLLTASCTMKGKAHDELHKWLLPFIELVNEFSTAKDNEVAAQDFVKIKNAFVEFHQYFQ